MLWSGEVKKAFIPESGKETILGKFSGDHLFCSPSDLLTVEVDEDRCFCRCNNEGWEILRSAAVAVHDLIDRLLT